MAGTMVHEPTVRGGGKGLWGHKGWELPAYIQHVFNDLVEGGKPHDHHTYRLAVGIVENWAEGHDGHGNKVSAETQAKAAKAIAEWNAKRAASKGMTAAKKSRAVESPAVAIKAAQLGDADPAEAAAAAASRIRVLEAAGLPMDGDGATLDRMLLLEAGAPTGPSGDPVDKYHGRIKKLRHGQTVRLHARSGTVAMRQQSGTYRVTTGLGKASNDFSTSSHENPRGAARKAADHVLAFRRARRGPVVEASAYEEAKHPRGGHGRWIKKLASRAGIKLTPDQQSKITEHAGEHGRPTNITRGIGGNAVVNYPNGQSHTYGLFGGHDRLDSGGGGGGGKHHSGVADAKGTHEYHAIPGYDKTATGRLRAATGLPVKPSADGGDYHVVKGVVYDQNGDRLATNAKDYTDFERTRSSLFRLHTGAGGRDAMTVRDASGGTVTVRSHRGDKHGLGAGLDVNGRRYRNVNEVLQRLGWGHYVSAGTGGGGAAGARGKSANIAQRSPRRAPDEAEVTRAVARLQAGGHVPPGPVRDAAQKRLAGAQDSAKAQRAALDRARVKDSTEGAYRFAPTAEGDGHKGPRLDAAGAEVKPGAQVKLPDDGIARGRTGKVLSIDQYGVARVDVGQKHALSYATRKLRVKGRGGK